ncbi:hypothetical protein ERO13_D07G168350v2 [Gossypium hirsutum]|nr:hypothetical protein ERO13_D07G168350v2 [Gossypium hirsutum]
MWRGGEPAGCGSEDLRNLRVSICFSFGLESLIGLSSVGSLGVGLVQPS